MDIKRFALSTIAVFLFIFFFEWFVNGVLLQGIYRETASNWRSLEEMHANFHIMVGFQFIISALITYMYTQMVTEGGAPKGLYFGLQVGALIGLLSAMSYVWLPIPAVLSLAWFVTGVVEGVVAGLILGTLYKSNETTSFFRSFWK